MPNFFQQNLRLAHFLERARALNFGRVWKLSGIVARTFRKSHLLVCADMLWSTAKYEAAFSDYLEWDFAILSPRERRSFVTSAKSDHFARRFNTDSAANRRISDKVGFNQDFSDLIGRDWLDLRSADQDQIAQFVKKHTECVAKDPAGIGGHSVSKLNSSDLLSATTVKRFKKTNQYLVEEYFRQHEQMSLLNPTSVNTTRVVTFKKGDQVSILCAALRIGAEGFVDNFAEGGMYTMVNEDGVAIAPAFDGLNNVHSLHPVTGTPIVGFQIPHFTRVKELVTTAALRADPVNYIGWDVAIGDDGPVLIEANYNTGAFQAKPSVSGLRAGLLPKYQEATGN
ncbi:MAG: sugar-transfer associated ATP-grasp domain-containing protein [Canibacter sp.]